jgi:hypothetical protein
MTNVDETFAFGISLSVEVPVPRLEVRERFL